ncbi:hypothetical protein CEE87_11430, partial [Lactobacillus crispatus]
IGDLGSHGLTTRIRSRESGRQLNARTVLWRGHPGGQKDGELVHQLIEIVEIGMPVRDPRQAVALPALGGREQDRAHHEIIAPPQRLLVEMADRFREHLDELVGDLVEVLRQDSLRGSRRRHPVVQDHVDQQRAVTPAFMQHVG